MELILSKYSYIILTTGDIKPKARVHIVDHFKGKNIKFIDGAMIVEWIREYYMDEFIALFGTDESEEEVEDEDISPLEMVVEFLEEKYDADINEVQASLNTLGRTEENIVRMLMLNSPLKKFALAKAMGRNQYSMDEEIRTFLMRM